MRRAGGRWRVSGRSRMIIGSPPGRIPGGSLESVDTSSLRELVRDIPDWPRPGIVFRDITPLLAAPDAFALTVDELAAPYADEQIDKVIGVEARGFVLAAPVASRPGAGFVPVAKVRN